MKKLLLLLLTVVGTLAFAQGVKPQWNNILGGSTENYKTQFVSSHESSKMVNTLHIISAVARPNASGTVTGAGTYEYGANCTLIATPAEDYQFVSWTKNGTTVSTNSEFTFTVIEDGSYVANFCSSQSEDVVIGSGSSTNSYLPTYSYFKYSFTEQIYTADEIGGPGVITAISFKVSNAKSTTRKVDLYLKTTDKTVFTSKTGWEPLPLSTRVYSGNVTFNASGWTTITMATPFIYDGTSNLVIGMDDNTGSYVSSSSNCPKFYVYPTGASRALRIYGDNNNYNPAAPTTYNGAYISSNDQIMITMYPAGGTIVNHTIIAAANPLEGGAVAGAGTFEEGSIITLKATVNEGYNFINWTKNGAVASTEANYTFTVTEDAIYVANFEEIIVPTFEITVAEVSNGTIVVDKTNVAAGELVSLTAIPNSGCNFSHWIVYVTGDINSPVSVNHNSFIMPEADVTVAALFNAVTGSGDVNTTEITIGSGSNFNSYLPTYAYYKYSFTEQIYTAAEIGQAGTITAVAFMVANSKSTTRNVDVYMKTTNKSVFASKRGWEPLASDNKVYSGQVTFDASGWTVITLNTPFVYDGTSNLIIGMDDNTGSYVNSSSNSPKFSVYTTGSNRSIRIYGDNTNYNPETLESYIGTCMSSNNQIQLTMMTNEGGSVNSETLFVTPDVLSDFTYVYGNGPSEVQSFAIIGSDLNAAVTVTAPFNYEICTTPNGTFENTVVIGGNRGNRDGSLTWDFEGTFDGWTTIDADGDGYNWEIASESMEVIDAHSGSDLLFSESYNNDLGSALTPDNWLISPQVPLGGTFTMWAGAQDADYPQDHFGIFLSTTSNTDPDSFVMLNEWTLSAKGNREVGNWYEYSVDLSAYAGEMGYIAVRHFNCTDEFQINVDDFTLTYDDTPVIPEPDPIHIDYLTVNVYVRLKAGLEEGRYNQDITITSGEATATVTLNGAVLEGRDNLDRKDSDAKTPENHYQKASFETANAVMVYPNPAARGERIRITIPVEVSLNEARIEIYNELGVMVYSERFSRTGIDNSFAAGLYTVRIIESNGNVHYSKLIVK